MYSCISPVPFNHRSVAFQLSTSILIGLEYLVTEPGLTAHSRKPLIPMTCGFEIAEFSAQLR